MTALIHAIATASTLFAIATIVEIRNRLLLRKLNREEAEGRKAWAKEEKRRKEQAYWRAVDSAVVWDDKEFLKNNTMFMGRD